MKRALLFIVTWLVLAWLFGHLVTTLPDRQVTAVIGGMSALGVLLGLIALFRPFKKEGTS